MRTTIREQRRPGSTGRRGCFPSRTSALREVETHFPMRPAGGESAVAAELLPTCGSVRRNHLLASRLHVLPRDVAGGTVQADVVVVLHVALDQTPCIFQRQLHSRPNALAFQRLVPALNLAVRLWMVREGSDVRHARDANELLEVAGNKLRTIVGDDSRLRFPVLSLARCRISSTSDSRMDSRRSQCTRKRLNPSRMLHK